MKNSLIKGVKIEATSGLPKNKITFTVVNDTKLVYFTNSDKFLEALNKKLDEVSVAEIKRFIIEYEITSFPKTLDESYINEEEKPINKVKFVREK